MADPENVRRGQLMEKYADAVSEEIRTSLRDAVPQLSASDFSELAKFHKTIDWSSIAVQCQEKIRDKLGHQFDESWDHLCMKRKIAVLEFLKRRAKNKEISQWRPYNKAPSDQCRPYIMDILNGKNYYLTHYLQEQQAKLIEDIVPAVDEYRSRIRKINEKRDLLVSQMERMDSTNRHTHEIFDDLEQNVKILRQLNREFTSSDQVTHEEEAESKKTSVSG